MSDKKDYTLIPNFIMEELPRMNRAECLLTIILVKDTYDKDVVSCKLTWKEIISRTGLSRGSITSAKNKVINRGFFAYDDLSNTWYTKGFEPEESISGYVYLIKMGEYHKIGITRDMTNRLTQIRGSSPYELKVVACEFVDNYKQVEADLHKKYSKKRVRGEWFALSKKDIEYIVSLLS